MYSITKQATWASLITDETPTAGVTNSAWDYAAGVEKTGVKEETTTETKEETKEETKTDTTTTDVKKEESGASSFTASVFTAAAITMAF